MRSKLVYFLAAVAAALLLIAAPAGAQAEDVYEDDPSDICSEVAGDADGDDVEGDGRSDPDCAQVLDSSIVDPADPTDPEVLSAGTESSGVLALTGSELVPFASVGVAAIALGTGLVLYRRRHAA